jgi:hypothetical protein
VRHQKSPRTSVILLMHILCSLVGADSMFEPLFPPPPLPPPFPFSLLQVLSTRDGSFLRFLGAALFPPLLSPRDIAVHGDRIFVCDVHRRFDEEDSSHGQLIILHKDNGTLVNEPRLSLMEQAVVDDRPQSPRDINHTYLRSCAAVQSFVGEKLLLAPTHHKTIYEYNFDSISSDLGAD